MFIYHPLAFYSETKYCKEYGVVLIVGTKMMYMDDIPDTLTYLLSKRSNSRSQKADDKLICAQFAGV